MFPKSLISRLGWMTVEQRYRYFINVLVFKCMSYEGPQSIGHSLQLAQNPYHTRLTARGNLALMKPRTERFKSSFIFAGPHFWNRLPSQLKCTTTLKGFKRAYKYLNL